MIARATRLSSPPEAMRLSGRAGSPGFGASRKTTWSIPVASNDTRVAVDLDRRFVRAGRPATEGDLEHVAAGSRAPRAPSPTLAASEAPTRAAPAGQLGGVRRPPPEQERSVVGLAPSPFLVHRAKALDLGGRALAVGDDRGLVVAVPPLERDDDRQALLDRREGGRVVIDPVGEHPRLGGDVGELGLGSAEALGRAPRSAGRAGRCGAPRAAPRPTVSRAPDPSPVSASWIASAPRAIASPCWAAPRRASRPAASPTLQAGGGDLGRLVSGDLDPARQLARIQGEGRERRPVRAPAFDGVRHPGAHVSEPAERIEQVALPALVEQPLLVVLAVDLHERPDRLREPCRGHRLVVEPGRRAAAGRQLPDGDQRLRDRVEQRFDPGSRRAVADESRIGPPARARARAHR